MEQQTDLFSSAIKIDGTAKMHIRSIASWAMIIVVATVFGYVINILELIISPAEPIVTQSEGFTTTFLSGDKSVGGTVITIMIGLLINYFLYRFASGIVSSVNGMSQEKFSSSFRNLKIYFAITTIILILFLLILLIAVLAFV
ncbi:MAG TPA: hypothetical protein VJU78_02495 [Chitinophagaceae bacterium]|nr:hypothetical protein [Chitinophagaceae bacterium]